MNKIRKSSVAGQFYPANPDELKKEIELFLNSSEPLIKPKTVFGLVSPHAGYIYSGKTAAYAYQLIKDKNIETVVIISPSHHEYFPGISVFDGDAYETPLGIIQLNKNFIEKLTDNSRYIFKGIAGHKAEHAIEVQLPFLQTVLNNFEIVPIVMGDQGKTFITELSSRLAEVIDDKTLIVASSDLSHYHPKPKAYELDSLVERRIIDFEYEKLRDDLEKGHCEACGGGPIVAMMQVADMFNKNKAAVVHRSDSGDTSGDNKQVVGYLSAAVYGE
jgi:AmmeMemoRadiSam system protein B